MTTRTDTQPANTFDKHVRQHCDVDLTGKTLDTVQVNIALRCNLACHHCHVASSPARDETMTWQTMGHVLDVAQRAGAKTLDITGGAPEMHPHFRRFVQAAAHQGMHVMVRTNLTIMLVDGYGDLPQFFASHGIHLVASLPCYLEINVDKQRGSHVYRQSVDMIQMLNSLGYGDDPKLQLDLVYNPGGPSLPPNPKALEDAYRRELLKRFNIRFNSLHAITNIPVGRFQHDLERDGQADEYRQLLRNTFNPATLDRLMCRHQLHVGWDGRLYDCDFNFAINLPARNDARSISDLDPDTFKARRIVTGEHCFGCTAGHGSSCGGALA